MQLRSKYYTYPVITEDADFYVDSSFSSNAEQILDGFNIRLKLCAKLVNPELEELLQSETVMIAHHIECTQTCFRHLYLTNETEKEVILRDSDVNGLVQICSFVVANRNIDKYSNSLFAQDFKGFRFDIERGYIMAIGNQINLRINKIRDDLANTSSIFSIVPNMDETETKVLIKTGGPKIVIMVPQETASIYSRISTSPELQPLMHSLLIIPALVYALNEVKNSRTNLDDYEEYRWYRSLRKAAEKMNVIFDVDTLEKMDSFEFAQKLMDSPIPKAINYLRGDSDEED